MTVLRSRSRQAGEHSEAQSLSAVLSDRAGPDDGKMRLGAFELWGRQAARPRLQMQVCGAAPGEFVKFRAAEPTLGVASGEPWPASGRSVQAVQDVDGPSHHGERMSVLRRNNVRVLGGSGPIIVYAHGFGCSSRMWERITPAFAATHRQVLFDFVGSGGSDTSAFDVARYSTLQGYAQDLIEVLDTLSLDGDVTFIGHSLSASIGLLASIVRPALFDRLILLGPSPCFLNHPPAYLGGFERADLEQLLNLMDLNFIGWANYLAPIVAGASGGDVIATEFVESFCTTDPSTARIFAEATFFADNRADLPRVTRPSLILQHGHDALAPLTVGQYLHEHLRESELRVLDVTGHSAHISNPELVIDAMRAYMHTHRCIDVLAA